MAVADIKEFIDKHTKGIYVRYETVDFVRLYNAMLKVRSMLDELDRPLVDIINEMNTELTKIDRAEKQMTNSDFYYTLAYYRDLLDELEDRPKAKWIKTSLSYYDDDYGYECSNCKEIYCTDYDFEEMAYNYCPNCGARMERTNEQKN